jgi:NAD+ synthetase
MIVALVQTNPTIGDFEGNARRLVSALREAEAGGAELAVATELAITGYPPRDLLDRPSFVALAKRWTRHVVEQTGRAALVFGTVGQLGGQLTNDAVAATGGRVASTSSKVLLPTYDVFDETRYFARGQQLGQFTHGSRRIAVSICEDAWAKRSELAGRYSEDPMDAVDPSNTDLLVNLSASPFTLSKRRMRPALFAELARRTGVPVVMVNQVGGNDELIFDGASTLFSANGDVLARAKSFEEDLLLTDVGGSGRVELEYEGDEEAAYRALVLGIRDYARKCGFQRAVLGLSGGIDSALVATLAADALGPENVVGVAMPARYSSEHSIADARALAANLGIRFELIDIDPIFATMLEQLSGPLDSLASPGNNDVTWENVQARIRGATVMAISNRTGALPLTTGNKSEIAVGYCTLYGDMVGGLAAISDVPKTMVYRISRWLNREAERIPANSITKPPSAELRPDQKDEDSLPPYDLLDAILERYVEDHESAHELVRRGFERDLVERVVNLVDRSEYKRRQAAPGLIITRKAFGPGRRIPVAKKSGDPFGGGGASSRNNGGQQTVKEKS